MSAGDDKREHWLARPATIRWLWRAFGLALGLAVAAQLFIDVPGRFGADGWVGFNAVLGFLACVALVLLAKVLGRLVKRPEQYYRDQRR